MSEIYDVIILGAGPAGLAAGLYAGRSRLNVLIIEKGQDGGQIAITDEIENYPGQIVEGETGVSLVRRRGVRTFPDRKDDEAGRKIRGQKSIGYDQRGRTGRRCKNSEK